MKRSGTVSGFSLTEVVIALSITTIAVTAATSGWIYIARGEKLLSVQSELDMDVRRTMETLKRDLKLSSLDKMYFYPAGPGPYTAISFPMAADTNNDGLVEMALGETNVLWQSTVIYHVWRGSPNELRKTVFSPRDNSLTPAQCQQQLESVVTNGSGSATFGSANASSRAIFKNLFTWSIWGKSATFDGYAPTLGRDTSVSFGSILLGPGTHQVKFNVIGKNASSSGYKVGLDTITASACGVSREGEAQLPVTAQSGATAASEYMNLGAWSGNYQLNFLPSSVGAYFTIGIDNDRWEETNFRGQGALCTRTVVGFDPNLSDYIVQLEGPGYPWGTTYDILAGGLWMLPYAWTAANQTGTTEPNGLNYNTFSNTAIRVLLRGRSLAVNNGAIRYSGQFPVVFFQAASNGALRIKAAYIAEAADHTNFTQNAATEGVTLLFSPSNSGSSPTISAGGNAMAFPASKFIIDAEKSYLITYLLESDNANPLVWTETYAGAPGSYVIPSSLNPTESDAKAADWSSKGAATISSLPGIAAVYTYYPTNGLFTSQIFDTKIETPVYSTISWTSVKPTGSSIKIKVRTGVNSDLNDAPAWSNVTSFLTSPADITCGNTRYIQFQAILEPDSTYFKTPELRDVTIKWAGATKVVDVGAIMTKGPNYGICEVTVDGNPLAKGLQIDLEIYEEIVGWGATGKTLTSAMSTEIEPRNTGK